MKHNKIWQEHFSDWRTHYMLINAKFWEPFMDPESTSTNEPGIWIKLQNYEKYFTLHVTNNL